MDFCHFFQRILLSCQPYFIILFLSLILEVRLEDSREGNSELRCSHGVPNPIAFNVLLAKGKDNFPDDFLHLDLNNFAGKFCNPAIYSAQDGASTRKNSSADFSFRVDLIQTDRDEIRKCFSDDELIMDGKSSLKKSLHTSIASGMTVQFPAVSLRSNYFVRLSECGKASSSCRVLSCTDIVRLPRRNFCEGNKNVFNVSEVSLVNIRNDIGQSMCDLSVTSTLEKLSQCQRSSLKARVSLFKLDGRGDCFGRSLEADRFSRMVQLRRAKNCVGSGCVFTTVDHWLEELESDSDYCLEYSVNCQQEQGESCASLRVLKPISCSSAQAFQQQNNQNERNQNTFDFINHPTAATNSTLDSIWNSILTLASYFTRPAWIVGSIVVAILIISLFILMGTLVACSKKRPESPTSQQGMPELGAIKKPPPRSLTEDDLEHISRLPSQEIVLVYFPDSRRFKDLNRKFRDWLVTLDVNDVKDIYDEKCSEDVLADPAGWVQKTLGGPEKRIILVCSRLAYECLLSVKKGILSPKFVENDPHFGLLTRTIQYLDREMRGNYRNLICVRYEDIKICDRQYSSEAFNIVPGTEYVLPQHLEDVYRWIHPKNPRPEMWSEFKPEVQELLESLRKYRHHNDNMFTVQFNSNGSIHQGLLESPM